MIAKPHFKGLNTLRGLAAFSVLFHHVELYKKGLGIPSLYDTNLSLFINALGKNGVHLFFVLSGFLITYLLLKEKSDKVSISIKNFYLRRILRIWPLYYLIIMLSLFVVPLIFDNLVFFRSEVSFYRQVVFLQNNFSEFVLLFLLFLPNVALYKVGTLAGGSQTWSVGVEEQFYLIWPWILQTIKGWFLFTLFLIIAFAYPYLPFIVKNFLKLDNVSFFEELIKILPIHFMAIGAIAGYLLFFYPDKLKGIIANPIIQLFAISVFIVLLFRPGHSLLYGYASALIILVVIHSKYGLKIKILDWFGDISYGIYMYHPIIMFLIFGIINQLWYSDNYSLFYHIIIYMGVISLTLFVSHFSFKYFENYFLRLKEKKFS